MPGQSVTRTILVTGGTGNLGRAVTERLLDEGHQIAVTWLVEKEKRRAEELESDNLMLVHADVTDATSIGRAVEEVERRFVGIDGLVHLVGGWSGGKRVEQHSDDSWRQMIDLNLTSAFLCCRAVLPGMRERDRGRIVLVSSRTAERERGGQVAYAIAKVGVEVLAQTIAEENKDANVTANVIAPSTLDTPANLAAMPDGDRAKWVTPQDVARSVAFLASDAAGPLRGARLPIYGGV